MVSGTRGASAPAALPPSVPFLLRKQCACGAVHTPAEWASNPTRRLGLMLGEWLEFVECRCGSTLSCEAGR